MNASQLLSELSRIASHPRGVIGRMSDLEREKGHGIIPWGALGVTEPIPFPEEEWHDGVITFDAKRKEIRLVAIKARVQQRGALNRLIASIRKAGYTPVVVEPIGHQMPAILHHWGWMKTLVEDGAEVVEEWRPADNVT
jgi:hypothetical protein